VGKVLSAVVQKRLIKLFLFEDYFRLLFSCCLGCDVSKASVGLRFCVLVEGGIASFIAFGLYEVFEGL